MFFFLDDSHLCSACMSIIFDMTFNLCISMMMNSLLFIATNLVFCFQSGQRVECDMFATLVLRRGQNT